jgi:hypothetical protein
VEHGESTNRRYHRRQTRARGHVVDGTLEILCRRAMGVEVGGEREGQPPRCDESVGV